MGGTGWSVCLCVCVSVCLRVSTRPTRLYVVCKDYSFFFIIFLRLRIIIVLLLIIITIKKSRAGVARVSRPPCNRVPEEWGRGLRGERKRWARVLLVPFHDATCAWLIKTES